MNNTNQERYFRYFIIALTAAVLLFVVMPAKADTCRNADTLACEDIVGAEVFFEQVTHTRFLEVCGVQSGHAYACARLNVSRRQCVIYYTTRVLDARVVEHELNHCRGWFHDGNTQRAHERPWVDYKTYIGE